MKKFNYTKWVTENKWGNDSLNEQITGSFTGSDTGSGIAPSCPTGPGPYSEYPAMPSVGQYGFQFTGEFNPSLSLSAQIMCNTMFEPGDSPTESNIMMCCATSSYTPEPTGSNPFCCNINAINFGQTAAGNAAFMGSLGAPEEYVMQNGPEGDLCDNSICQGNVNAPEPEGQQDMGNTNNTVAPFNCDKIFANMEPSFQNLICKKCANPAYAAQQGMCVCCDDQNVKGKSPIKKRLREQTNVQTIQGGGCSGDIIVNHTYNSNSFFSAFIYFGNTYGMSANFADYAFPTDPSGNQGGASYVNIGLSINHDNLKDNLSGIISYPSFDAAFEAAGTGTFTTVQAFLQSLTAVGGAMFSASNCFGVTGVDNSLPTAGFEPAVGSDISDPGVAPDFKSKPNLQKIKRKIRESIKKLKRKK